MGHLRVRLKTDEIEISIASEEPLHLFLDRLANSYPDLCDVIKSIKDNTGEYLLLVNDVDVNIYGGIDKVRVRDNDILIFVPVVHGGRK